MRLAFVEPDDNHVVRLDLNDLGRGVFVDEDGFDPGSPAFDGDLGGVGAEYGFRRIALGLWVVGDSYQANRVQSLLAREILRDEPWLMIQLEPHVPPMWAQCVRATPGQIRLRREESDGTVGWYVSVELVAASFLLGERETLGVPTLVPNDPDAGGLFAVLPEVKGDAPAPLSIYNSTRWHSFGFAALTEVAPLWKQAEDCTLGFDTSAPDAAPDAAMSGTGSTNFARITFGTTALRNRITWTVNNEAVSDDVRRYLARVSQVRVLVYVRSTTGGDFTLRARSESASDTTLGPLVPVSPGATRQVVDLGAVTIARSTGGDYPSDALWQVQIQAGRDSGAGSLDVDTVVLVPADRQMWFGRGSGSSDFNDLCHDAEREVIFEATGGPDSATIRVKENAATPLGGILHVRPGESNVLTWQSGHGPFLPFANCDVTHESELSLSYRPRWLWLAGG